MPEQNHLSQNTSKNTTGRIPMEEKDLLAFRKKFRPVNCSLCPCKGLPKVIADAEPSSFPGRIDVLFVGVNPGTEEAKQGIPFCGRAGKLLRRLAREELGLASVAYTNIILCSTNSESTIPDRTLSFSTCRPNLTKICQFFSPYIYVPCGNYAMRESGIAGSISVNQGMVFEVKKATIIPCLHPSAILHGFASEDALRKTMQNVRFALLSLKKKSQA